MTSEEVGKLAESLKDSDPSMAIVLYVLAGSKCLENDGEFARYCQEFAKQMVSEIHYVEWVQNG